uniref:ERCC4 domain-containing protein n=1 Tax=viral metagenome TaxID=1070528 RepID=A0A6C0CK79_9ZZZZ
MPDKTKLIITPNETALIKECETQNITFETKPLDIGDIQIVQNGNVQYLIERKADGDLEASIKDGRYKEQKARIKSSGLAPQRVIYLMERFPDDVWSDSERKRLFSALTNTLVRDRMMIYQTKSLKETAQFLKSLCKSVDKFLINGKLDPKSQEIIEMSQSQIKKLTSTPQTIFRDTLTLIPRSTKQIADYLVELYPDATAFVEQASVDVLKKMKIPGRKTALGPVLSKNLLEFVKTLIKKPI